MFVGTNLPHCFEDFCYFCFDKNLEKAKPDNISNNNILLENLVNY